MFDIGISEIGVIAVVALIVIGPERLPRVARTIGTLLGRAQRYVNDVKAEVNREIELDELRKLQAQMQDAARGIQQSVTSAGAEMQSAVHDMERQLQQGVSAVEQSVTSESTTAAPAIAGLADPAAVTPGAAPSSSPAGTEPTAAGPTGGNAVGYAEPSPAGSAGAAAMPSAVATEPATPEPRFEFTELQEPPMEPAAESAPSESSPATEPSPAAAPSTATGATTVPPLQSSLFPDAR